MKFPNEIFFQTGRDTHLSHDATNRELVIKASVLIAFGSSLTAASARIHLESPLIMSCI